MFNKHLLNDPLTPEKQGGFIIVNEHTVFFKKNDTVSTLKQAIDGTRKGPGKEK